MNRILLLLLTLVLSGCADYSMHARVDGVSGPNDLLPQPFPDAPPSEQK